MRRKYGSYFQLMNINDKYHNTNLCMNKVPECPFTYFISPSQITAWTRKFASGKNFKVFHPTCCSLVVTENINVKPHATHNCDVFLASKGFVTKRSKNT